MDEKKGMLFIRTRDLIIGVLIVGVLLYFGFEIFKIKHQMKFATLVNTVNANTAWIQNVNRSAQQQRAKSVQPLKEAKPEKN